MNRILVVLGLVAGLVLLTPTAALACSCAQSSPGADAKKADTILVGTLAWVTDNRVEATYGVNVTTVYKGKAASFEKVRSEPNSVPCGLSAPIADGVQRYVFFLQGSHPGQMLVEGCGGTAAYDDALVARVLSVTGPGVEPIPAPPPVEEATSTGIGTFGVVLLGTTLALIIGLGVVAARSRPSS